MAGETMRKRLAILIGLLWLTSAALASEEQADHYKIGKVAKVSITNATERSDFNPQETCETFVMTPRRVKDFFSHAKVTSANYHHYQDDLSSCSSEGTVEFSNGDKGHWTISRNGVGLMSILNKEALKDDVIYLHCDKCEDWGM